MRVIGVRRSWPAAATSRMRLSIARFSREESEFKRLGGRSHLGGPFLGQDGQRAVGSDLLDRAFEQRERPAPCGSPRTRR